MSTAILQTTTPPSVDVKLHALKVPSATEVGLGALDVSGRAIEASENILRNAKSIVDETVPGICRFVGSFLIPEMLNYHVYRLASLGTKIGTSVLTSGANAMLNITSLGLPTWIKAARRTMATSDAVLSGDWNRSAEVLARCVAESPVRPAIKRDLTEYIEARKELLHLERRDGADPVQVERLRNEIIKKESFLKGFQDYEFIKGVLDRGMEYVSSNYERIVSLAEETADRLLKRVENYYVDRLGAVGGVVEGNFARLGNDAERLQLRNELRDRIAGKLKDVFANEMDRKEVKQRLRAISSELLEAFGAYREGMTALGYVALGIGYYTGGLSILADKALEFAGGVKSSVLTYMGGLWDGTKDWAWSHTFGAVHDAWSAFWQDMYMSMPEFVRGYLGSDSGVPTPQPLPVPDKGWGWSLW